MKEIDRLRKMHADDPPPHRVGQCAECRGWFRTVGRDGTALPPHPAAGSGEPCACRVPVESSIEEYTVGFDQMYGVWYGGAWELGK